MKKVILIQLFLLTAISFAQDKIITKKHIERHMDACYCKQLYTTESLTQKLNIAGFKNVKAYYIMGSRVSVFWEILMEKIGVFAFFFLPIFWPLIMILEGTPKKSGYKIFVKASK